jgi:hypothetical protein
MRKCFVLALSMILSGAFAVTLMAQQPRYLPAEIDAGGRVYTSTCTGCHGPDGDGVAGINFSQGRYRRAASDDDLCASSCAAFLKRRCHFMLVIWRTGRDRRRVSAIDDRAGDVEQWEPRRAARRAPRARSVSDLPQHRHQRRPRRPGLSETAFSAAAST